MMEEQHLTDPNGETLARHHAMVDAFEGKRPMDWSVWDWLIDDSTCLTAEGRRVAHWAVATLQEKLGQDFLQLVQAKMTSHPIFSLGFWPANDVAWVYANLIQLATQLHLFHEHISTNRFGRVLKDLRQNLQPITWIGTLLQLEIAGLGLRAGWEIEFEPSLGKTHFADVRFTHDASRLLVETTSLRLSNNEQQALAFYQQFGFQLMNLEWKHGIRICRR